MVIWSSRRAMSMSFSETPGSSAVTVIILLSSAMSTRGARVPPMLRPNQSSKRESTCVLKLRKCSTSRLRSPHGGSQDFVDMGEPPLRLLRIDPMRRAHRACCPWAPAQCTLPPHAVAQLRYSSWDGRYLDCHPANSAYMSTRSRRRLFRGYASEKPRHDAREAGLI